MESRQLCSMPVLGVRCQAHKVQQAGDLVARHVAVLQRQPLDPRRLLPLRLAHQRVRLVPGLEGHLTLDRRLVRVRVDTAHFRRRNILLSVTAVLARRVHVDLPLPHLVVLPLWPDRTRLELRQLQVLQLQPALPQQLRHPRHRQQKRLARVQARRELRAPQLVQRRERGEEPARARLEEVGADRERPELGRLEEDVEEEVGAAARAGEGARHEEGDVADHRAKRVGRELQGGSLLDLGGVAGGVLGGVQGAVQEEELVHAVDVDAEERESPVSEAVGQGRSGARGRTDTLNSFLLVSFKNALLM